MKSVPKGQIHKYVSIYLGNGLAPYVRQTLSWNKADQTPWCRMAPLVHSELKPAS